MGQVDAVRATYEAQIAKIKSDSAQAIATLRCAASHERTELLAKIDKITGQNEQLQKENEDLKGENRSLKDENKSFRDENKSVVLNQMNQKKEKGRGKKATTV
jgi:cell division septum initiation protein DivIVA